MLVLAASLSAMNDRNAIQSGLSKCRFGGSHNRKVQYSFLSGKAGSRNSNNIFRTWVFLFVS